MCRSPKNLRKRNVRFHLRLLTRVLRISICIFWPSYLFKWYSNMKRMLPHNNPGSMDFPTTCFQILFSFSFCKSLCANSSFIFAKIFFMNKQVNVVQHGVQIQNCYVCKTIFMLLLFGVDLLGVMRHMTVYDFLYVGKLLF